MRIIKEAKFEEEWKGECDNCGSIFEATFIEVSPVYVKDKDIKTAYGHSSCRVCGQDTSIVFYQKSYYDELNQK